MFKVILSVSVFAILIFNFIATPSGWYEALPWLDVFMHLGGGAWVAGLFLYVFGERWRVFGIAEYPYATFIFALGFVALIGVLWEFYEYGVDEFLVRKEPQLKNWGDTLADLLNDFLGGAGTLLLWRIFSRKTPRNI